MQKWKLCISFRGNWRGAELANDTLRNEMDQLTERIAQLERGGGLDSLGYSNLNLSNKNMFLITRLHCLQHL